MTFSDSSRGNAVVFAYCANSAVFRMSDKLRATNYCHWLLVCKDLQPSLHHVPHYAKHLQKCRLASTLKFFTVWGHGVPTLQSGSGSWLAIRGFYGQGSPQGQGQRQSLWKRWEFQWRWCTRSISITWPRRLGRDLDRAISSCEERQLREEPRVMERDGWINCGKVQCCGIQLAQLFSLVRLFGLKEQKRHEQNRKL